MTFLPWTTLSLVIDGDDLVSASVSGSPIGTRAARGPRVSNVLKAPSDEVRRALAGTGHSRGRVVLTVPASWCNIRPIALRRRHWQTARPEIMRSLSGLFPLAPADAIVGLIDRVADSTTPGGAKKTADPTAAGGYLIAVDRDRLDPWLSAIRSALGREVDLVLAPHMAFFGLGLQSVERAEILEQQTSGALVCHRLWRGEITELFRPYDESESVDAAAHLRLFSAGSGKPDSGTSNGATLIDPGELAIGAAIATRVAPERFAPLLGQPPSVALRWAPPAAAALLALAAIWGATWTMKARYLAAAERIEQRQILNEQALLDVQSDRIETLRLVALLEAAARGPAASRRSVLSDLSAAHAALPADGFLYRVEVDAGGVSLRGESQRASDVLQRLESTPGFRSARNVSSPALVEERRSEMFDVRAERAPATPTGGAR